jgi:lambda family phage tail tape measure protein
VGLAVGLSKLIDDLMKKIGTGISGALTMPNIPTPPPGTTPDLSGLRTGDGGKKKKADDEAKRRRDALLDSANALKQSRAELQIEREMDPMRKIQLEYAEKRRVVIANADKALREALSGEQQANIQRTRSVDLQKLQVQESNALIEKFKELKGAGFEAAMSGELFYVSVEKTTSVMQDFSAGIDSYIESMGTLGTNLSNLAQNGFKGLEDAIVSMTTTGTFSFQEFARSIVDEIVRMITRLLVIAPLLQYVQSLINPTKGLFGIPKLDTSVGFGTGVTGFAKGGIVNKATMFTFADGGSGRFGLAGEAGPEAIMPLRRGRDGRLGVQAAGGGVKVGEINITVQNTGENLSPLAQKQVATQVQNLVLVTLANEKRSGGMLR